MTAARAAVLRQYATAYDSFAEQAQLLVGEGRYDEAKKPNAYASLVLRAFRGESDCPAAANQYFPHRDVSNDRGGTR